MSSHNKDTVKQEISYLFSAAKDEIEKINQYADEKKKDIVVRLAKDLEGKISKETICMKIVKELDGKVSDTLIRNCLPQEYKQGHRRENAKKKQEKKEPKLAPLLVLKPKEKVDEEENKQKNHEVVMTSDDGMTYTEQKADTIQPSSFKDHYTSKDNVFDQTNRLQERQEQHPVDRSSQFETAGENKIESKEMGTYSEPSYDNNKDILPFEFRLNRKAVRNHLDSVEPNTDDDICFNGKIDLKTGDVISANIGRPRRKMWQKKVTETILLL